MKAKDLKEGEFYIFNNTIFLYNGIDLMGRWPKDYKYSFTVIIADKFSPEYEAGYTSRWSKGFINLLKPLNEKYEN